MHLSKLFYFCFINIKSSSTWLIPASLCERPFFYIYVESSPFFEHHPIEHCCHSEYNVLCPKVLMIGACLRYPLSSENFTSSLRLISQELPFYVFLYKRGKREITTPCLVISIASVLLVACLNYYLLAFCFFAWVSMIAQVLLFLQPLSYVY